MYVCTTYAIGNVCVQHGDDIHTMAPSSEFLAHSTDMVQLENPYMTHMRNYSMGIPAPTIHTPKSKSLHGDAHNTVLRHPLKFKLRKNASNSRHFAIQKNTYIYLLLLSSRWSRG